MSACRLIGVNFSKQWLLHALKVQKKCPDFPTLNEGIVGTI